MQPNESFVEVKRRFARSAINVSFVAQEALECRHSYKLEDVLQPLEQDMQRKYVSVIGWTCSQTQSEMVKPVRHMEGLLRVVGAQCTWCSSFFRPPVLKCILKGSVLKVGEEDDAKYYCFNATPFQLKCYQNSFKILLEGYDLDVVFECDNANELQQWQRLVGEAVQQSVARKQHITQTLTDDWMLRVDFNATQKEFVLEDEFSQQCQTGDILLFTGKHLQGKLQRTIFSSDYDHVGVVIRDDDGRIRIFESTSANGVCALHWRENFIRYKWYDCIKRIAWRRLRVQRTPKFLRIFNAFLRQQLNKAFGIGIIDILLANESEIPPMNDEGEQLHTEFEVTSGPDTYFCSQLVARLYKFLGLIDQKVSSKKYLPKSFSDAGSLKILGGGCLQKERVLVFDERLIRNRYQLPPDRK